MDFFKYFSYYCQKIMISPCYFGPPVLGDPVYLYITFDTCLHTSNIDIEKIKLLHVPIQKREKENKEQN
jgi:hypothetical protein